MLYKYEIKEKYPPDRYPPESENDTYYDDRAVPERPMENNCRTFMPGYTDRPPQRTGMEAAIKLLSDTQRGYSANKTKEKDMENTNDLETFIDNYDEPRYDYIVLHKNINSKLSIKECGIWKNRSEFTRYIIKTFDLESIKYIIECEMNSSCTISKLLVLDWNIELKECE